MAEGTTEIAGGGEGSRSLTAAAIADAVGGVLRGDGSAVISAVAPLDRAQRHHLTFLASARYAPLFAESDAGVALVTPELEEAPGRVRARVVVPSPHDAMLSLLEELYPPPPPISGVHPTAVIGRGARIGEQVWIGPYAVLGDGSVIGNGTHIDAQVVVGAGVEIGSDCHLFPGACLYTGTVLGDRVRVHSGVRLGSDGFGYVYRDGRHEKIPHVGRCILESDVEIGANSTVDRGSIDDTVIGAGTKIDNLVQVAHGVTIGRNVLLAGQVGVAGSSTIEDSVTLAGQVGVAGHITIGKGTIATAQTGIPNSVEPGSFISGYPAIPNRDWLKSSAIFRKLPEFRKVMADLERRLAQLEARLKDR